MTNETDTTILSDRETKIANAFFEIMQPRLRHYMKQFFEARSLETEIFWKEQMVPSISKDVREKIMSDVEKMIDDKLDAYKESEFDIHSYTGEIEDIVSDWIRYNLTLTTTVD
tara:strand:+ start:3147 stop:3485 length:339 start_codon:yes stop_codon:yes gene_type:complete